MTNDRLELSAELRLLWLLSERHAWQGQRIQPLLVQVDFLQFQQLIEFHRLWLAVSRNLRQLKTASGAPLISLCPDEFVQWLQQSQQAAQQKTLAHWLMQQQLSAALQALAVPHQFIKGLGLSLKLHGELGWRFSRDIDLLIEPASRQAVAQLLRERGFHSEFDLLPANGLGTRWLMHLQKDEHWYHKNGIALELHWRLASERTALSNQLTPVFLQLAPQQLSVDELVYLCWHAMYSRCHRMKWALDVADYIHVLSLQQPDWQQQAFQCAARLHVTAQLTFMLHLVALLPALTRGEQLQGSQVLPQDVRELVGSWQHGSRSERATFTNLWFLLKYQRNPLDWLKAGVSLVFWPNVADLSWLNRLPKPVALIYFLAMPLLKPWRYLIRRLFSRATS